MKLTVNGDAIIVNEPLTVLGLLQQLKLTDGPVAVERNREIIPRAQHDATWLIDGDELEVVHFVGGG